MINVTFSSSPVTEVFRKGFCALPMSNVIPAKTVLCKDLEEVLSYYHDFVEDVRATGKPAVCCFFKAHRQPAGARKPAGFDKAGARQVLLNTASVQRKETAEEVMEHCTALCGL